MVADRLPTDPPKTFGGWVVEVLTLFIVVTVIAAVAGVIWALHMREIHVMIERASCAQVVFSHDGIHWNYEPELDQCQLFMVGSRWVIEVNELGTIRPVRRE